MPAVALAYVQSKIVDDLHRRLQERLEQAGLTGFRFREPPLDEYGKAISVWRDMRAGSVFFDGERTGVEGPRTTRDGGGPPGPTFLLDFAANREYSLWLSWREQWRFLVWEPTAKRNRKPPGGRVEGFVLTNAQWVVWVSPNAGPDRIDQVLRAEWDPRSVEVDSTDGTPDADGDTKANDAYRAPQPHWHFGGLVLGQTRIPLEELTGKLDYSAEAEAGAGDETTAEQPPREGDPIYTAPPAVGDGGERLFALGGLHLGMAVWKSSRSNTLRWCAPSASADDLVAWAAAVYLHLCQELRDRFKVAPA